MKAAAAKTWMPTKSPNLYRHSSGTYYARISQGDKKTWRSLKTKVLSVAKAELEQVFQTLSYQTEVSQSRPVSEHMTGAEALEIRKRQVEDDPSIKKNTRKYWNEVMTSLKKTWPELLTAELRRVTDDQCQAWAGRNKDSMSPTRFNNSVSLIKTLFDIAVKRGARRSNPAADLKKVRVRSKDLTGRLPNRETFDRWVAEMRRPNARFSKACADFVEFLACTGVRKGETEWILWKHCDFATGEILVVGEPEDGTKNGEMRRIPMIPACRALLSRLKAESEDISESAPVLKVQEAQKAMDRAAAVVGMPRITHHDLRHLFATVCIESGVDTPTVSRWLGHKDGGALAMKVYGHLRNEHSLAAAARVSFK